MALIGKDKKKLAKEAATAEFNRIVEHFGFTISTEVKDRVVTMNINNVDMVTRQEMADADAFISRIMDGKIRFDEERKQIVYKLPDPITTGEGGSIKTEEFRFGKFTRAMQKSIRYTDENGKEKPVQLREINFGTMDDAMADAVIMGMAGISDPSIINKLDIPEYNDIRMLCGYFFG